MSTRFFYRPKPAPNAHHSGRDRLELQAMTTHAQPVATSAYKGVLVGSSATEKPFGVRKPWRQLYKHNPYTPSGAILDAEDAMHGLVADTSMLRFTDPGHTIMRHTGRPKIGMFLDDSIDHRKLAAINSPLSMERRVVVDQVSRWHGGHVARKAHHFQRHARTHAIDPQTHVDPPHAASGVRRTHENMTDPGVRDGVLLSANGHSRLRAVAHKLF